MGAHGWRSVAEFLIDEWLPEKRATVKATTLASYRLHVNAYIVPQLGAVRLSALRAPQLNTFYADLLEQGRCNGAGFRDERAVSVTDPHLSRQGVFG